jgi:type II secretory pathway predicted ATPase ExeA
MFTQYAPVAKLAIAITANLGVAKIVGDVVKNNVVVTSTIQAITVKAGSLVITSMVCEKASVHVAETVDTVTAWLDQKKEEVEKTVEEVKKDDDIKEEEGPGPQFKSVS